MEDVDGPWIYAPEADEEVDGRGERGRRGRGRVLCSQDDRVGAPLELKLRERVGDGGSARGE